MVIAKGLNGDEEILVNVPPSVTDGSQVVLRGSAEGKGENGASAKEGGKGGDGKGKKAKDSPAKDEASKEAK